MIWIILGIVVVIIIAVTIVNKGNEEAKNILDSALELEKKNGFQVDKIYRDEKDNFWLIALDQSKEQILHIVQHFDILTDGNNEETSTWKINFSDIIDCEVLIDDQSISKSSTGNIVAGAILGGGIGALIGSQIKKKTQTEVKSIELKIITNDIINPIRKITFYKPGIGTPTVAIATNLIEEWHGVIVAIMHKEKSNN